MIVGGWWGPWCCDFSARNEWDGLKCDTHVCIHPICYLESHVTGWGHEIHRGTAGALSVGHESALAMKYHCHVHYWHLLVGLEYYMHQSALAALQNQLKLLYFRDELYAHVCNIHSFLPRPFYLSSHLSFFFSPLQAKSCSGGVMFETWPWSGCVSSTTIAG